ncbi:helicase, partial [Rhizobium leguminosarum]
MSPLKSLDLSFVRSQAFQLSRDLMVTVFAADGKYGVLPSEEIDAEDDLAIVHDSFRGSGVP